MGPMIWAPMSEIPQIGRNPVYIGTLFVFVIFQVPTALSVNFGMLLAFRFLTGFIGSPVLATGGASIADSMWISDLYLFTDTPRNCETCFGNNYYRILPHNSCFLLQEIKLTPESCSVHATEESIRYWSLGYRSCLWTGPWSFDRRLRS